MKLRDRTPQFVWLVIGALLATAAIVGLDRSIAVDAAPGDLDSTFVPVAPCRAFDYRPGADNVGARDTPLGEGEAHTQQITGNVGNCVGTSAVPSTAVGVALNVTIAQPTAQSNLRLYPADVETPLVSNLNWLAGQSPTPNKVDVKLSPTGAIKVENFKGTVFVIGDVVGYYTSSSLTELSETVASLEQRLAAVENSRSFSVTRRTPQPTPIPLSGTAEAGFVEVTAPVDGHVVIQSTAVLAPAQVEVFGSCSISDTMSFDTDYEQYYTKASTFAIGSISGHRQFAIAAGTTATYRLICSQFQTTSTATDVVLTATFTPAP
ncbi:MAG: hypothetical protein AAFY28_15215 [Actinomycetota bacterium]